MVTLRCTQKLLQRARLIPSSTPVEPTTRLGDWYATVVPFRKPLVLALSEKTLLAVVLPLAPAGTLLRRWPAAVRELLGALGLPPGRVAEEVLAMQNASVGVTASRGIVGCLSEAVARVRWFGGPENDAEAHALNLRLAELIYSTTNYESPTDAAFRAFGLPAPPRRHLQ
jgi:hypothetical protein